MIYRLQGVVQHYSWGGTGFIPQLISTENREEKPFAEYWLGTHPNAPARMEGGDLRQLIEQQPNALLGHTVSQRFHSLPFLFKVLDVRQMLSIQVHPDKASAEKGFEEEEARGIAMNAPHRNYKDRNHKPELMAALSDFWLLHGFKPAAALEEILGTVPGLQVFLDAFRSEGYRGLYQRAMTLPQSEVDAILGPIAERILPLYRNNELEKRSEDFWAARAMTTYCQQGHYDRGIFSIYFFNLLHLQKGEGIYQGAGLPHAYLEGQNIEVMANSDNVLRAGLTDKHVDIDELMKHVLFEATEPRIIRAGEGEHMVYPSPALEFELHRWQWEGSLEVGSSLPQVALLLQGEVELVAEGQTVELRKGDGVFLAAGAGVSALAKASSVLFSVRVPGETKI